MASESRSGRPRASSREVLAEAACELFLEQGYDATTVTDITRRAGVSRSSFFNYFDSKADLLWGALDERIVAVETALAGDRSTESAAAVRTTVAGIAAGFAPDTLALAVANAEAMGLAEQLERDAAVRAARIARAVAGHLHRAGMPRLRAAVIGAACGGAVIAAIEQWARDAPGHTALPPVLEEAFAAVDDLLSAATD